MKAETVKQSSHRAYEVVTRNFVNYLDDNGIEATDSIDGYLIEQWKLKRQEEDSVAPATLHNNTKHLRVFIKYLESSELVAPGLYDKVTVPNISKEDARSDEAVKPAQIEQILNHIATYEYATRKHAFIKLLWHIGCRISGLIAADVDDFRPGEKMLRLRNRKQRGTGLKNRDSSERNVTLNDDTIAVVNDYVNGRRDEVMDEHGREPLFTTAHGRMSRQRAYKDFVAASRPCEYRGNCPHDRKIQECEAAQKKNKAFECPSSDSLHPIRRGSITHHLTQGWDKQHVSERCDVSVAVLEKHYDVRTHEEERATRSQDIDKL